jgi:hypothetical protein
MKRKTLIKYSLALLALAMLVFCIFGVPVKEAKTAVKSHGAEVSGTFTGMWSPVRGKRGTFTAEEGWTFEGIINPDGGMHEGQLVNYPFSPDERANSVFDLPAFYTGRIEDSVFTDVNLK